MGFLNLFNNAKKAASAKAQNVADKIEEDNAVDFSKMDLAQVKADVRTVKSNIGSIKGEIAVLEDKVTDLKMQIKKHDDDATALMATGNETLAEKHAVAAGALEKQIDSLQLAIDQQKETLAGQIQTKDELEASVQQAEADLVSIKAMTDAATANEKLAKISTASGTSALAAFEERREAAKKRLIKSQAMKEESGSDSSLEKATEAALGNTLAKDRLARLKKSVV
jgi:phage shock protein A